MSKEIETQTAKMKYRKKPVVIEAFQLTWKNRNSADEWPDWFHAAWRKDMHEPGAAYPLTSCCETGEVCIVTLEGNHTASIDDFIIQGVQGELYPCKPDIFEATYEPVV